MQTIVGYLKFRYCVGNIADISVEVDISMINYDFLSIIHKKFAKKKKNKIHQRDNGKKEEREKKKKRMEYKRQKVSLSACC